MRREIDEKYPDRVLLAEANQWPADVVEYFGEGDECHMAFHFPVMPRMFMAVRREEATPIYEILEQTPEIPDNCQWGLFLRNHDELTLEMVTDEERDYMYAEYAKDPRMKINVGIRRRLAPLLDNGRDEIELMTAILFSLPGSPVLYYGDEIAMGDNVFLGDRDGVRTPMQWTGDRNGGFSRADFAQLYAPPLMDPVYGFQAVNVEAQLRTPTSLLRWMHRFIALRKEHPVFGFGTYEPLETSNPRIFAHLRRFEDDVMLCVHNVARSAQAVELDLSALRGPPSGGAVRPLALPADRRAAVSAHARAARLLLVPAGRRGPTGGGPMTEGIWAPGTDVRHFLDVEALRDWVEDSAGTRPSRATSPVSSCSRASCWPSSRRCCWRSSRRASPPARTSSTSCRSASGPGASWAAGADRLHRRVDDLRRAVADPEHARELLRRIDAGRPIEADDGTLRFSRADGVSALPDDAAVRLVGVEQSNSSIVFGDELVLKVFRKLEPGINPELEMLRFLTAREFPNIAPLLRLVRVRRPLVRRPRSAWCSASSRTRSTAGSWRWTSSSADPDAVPASVWAASARSRPRCTPCWPPTPATPPSRPRSPATRRWRC